MDHDFTMLLTTTESNINITFENNGTTSYCQDNETIEFYETISQTIWMVCPPILLVCGGIGKFAKSKIHM